MNRKREMYSANACTHPNLCGNAARVWCLRCGKSFQADDPQAARPRWMLPQSPVQAAVSENRPRHDAIAVSVARG